MRIWEAKVISRYNDRCTFNVAAKSIQQAIKKVQQAAKRDYCYHRVQFESIIQTTVLDN